mgnify:CR=1 FL=1
MKVGLCYSRIRKDEKLLLGELRDRGHEVAKVDVRRQRFGLEEPPADMAGVDAMLAMEAVEEVFDVVPDIMVVGKGLSSGYAPISGMLVRDEIAGPCDSVLLRATGACV